MNAFAAHDDRALLRFERLAAHCAFEMRNTALWLGARAAPAGHHPIGSGALEESVEQHALEIAAVDRELRHVVSGEPSRGLAVDELAEAIEEREFACDYGSAGERVLEAEPDELP
jgi:hypothetical protein